MSKRFLSVFSVFAVVFFFVVTSYAQEAVPPTALTNPDVIKMVEAKLGDDVIVAKIKSSPSNFNTGIDAILKLRDAGASNAVIQAMVEASAAANSVASAAAAKDRPYEPNDPKSPHDPGIYWLLKSQSEQRLVRLQPTAREQTLRPSCLAPVQRSGATSLLPNSGFILMRNPRGSVSPVLSRHKLPSRKNLS